MLVSSVVTGGGVFSGGVSEAVWGRGLAGRMGRRRGVFCGGNAKTKKNQKKFTKSLNKGC